MYDKIGILGLGNMASAMVEGWLRKTPLKFVATSRHPDRLRRRYQNVDRVSIVDTAEEVLEATEVLLLAIKPWQAESVLLQLHDHFTPRHLILSVLAGISAETLRSYLPEGVSVISVLPNLPVRQGKGLLLAEPLRQNEEEMAHELLDPLGQLVFLEGKAFVAGSAMTGCGPAFAALFVEGLADGAVAHGLPRATAYELASAMVEGTMVDLLDTRLHPGEYKDQLCSPGGITIKGIRALEQGAFRGTVMASLDAVLGDEKP